MNRSAQLSMGGVRGVRAVTGFLLWMRCCTKQGMAPSHMFLIQQIFLEHLLCKRHRINLARVCGTWVLISVTIPFASKLRSVDLSQSIEGLQMVKASWRRQVLLGLEAWLVSGEEETRGRIRCVLLVLLQSCRPGRSAKLVLEHCVCV